MTLRFACFEFLSIVRRWPFLVGCFFLPFISTVSCLLARFSVNNTLEARTNEITLSVGIVDDSQVTARLGGELSNVPIGGMKQLRINRTSLGDDDQISALAAKNLGPKIIRYEDTSTALAALRAGEVIAVAHIPAEYFSKKKLTVFAGTDARAAYAGRLAQGLWSRSLLFSKGLDSEHVNAAWLDPKVEKRGIDGSSESPPSVMKEGLLGTVLFCVIIWISVYAMISSTADRFVEDRQSKTIDTYLTAISEKEYILGKLLGVFGAGLLQGAVWIMSCLIYISLAQRGARLDLSCAALILISLFVVLGSGFYLFLTAGLTSAAATPEEGRTIAMVVKFICTINFVLFLFPAVVLQVPHTLLEIINPLAAPFALSYRVAQGTLELWEICLGGGVLILANWAMFRLALMLFLRMRNAEPLLRLSISRTDAP